jgi:hypothetical protein
LYKEIDNMSFVENVKISASDSPTIDAFARLRVSNPFTIFDSKQVHDNQPLFWGESLSGSASSVHSSVDARTRLSVTANGTDVAIRQTKQYFNYQPGKSQLYFITGLFSQQTNVEKEVGLDDGSNGIVLRVDGTASTDISWLIRKNSSVSEEVARGSWNVDNFDGTGPSGFTLDLNQAQIIYIDFEWLGVGRVRCGFVIDGVPYVAHQFLHANRSGNSSVYTSNPNYPVRYYIKSNGGSGSLDHICATVISEGGQQNTGVLRSVDTGGTTESISSGDHEPLVAIRHQSTKKTSTIIAKVVSIMSTSGANFRWSLLLNPTSTTGTDFTTGFTALSDSTIEFKNSFTGTISDEGIKIASGYGSNNTDSITTDVESFLRIGTDISTGNQDVLVLTVISVGGNENFCGSITFREIV